MLKIVITLARKSSIKRTVVYKSVENVVSESRKTSNGHGCCQTVYFCVNTVVKIGLATASHEKLRLWK